MSHRYTCDSASRLAHLIASEFKTPDGPDGIKSINAIDYLEVVDGVLDAKVTASDDPRQLVLLVRFHLPLAANTLDYTNVQITGGTTITEIGVVHATRLADLPAKEESPWTTASHGHLKDRKQTISDDVEDDPTNWLIVLVDQRGDHSMYRFKLVDGSSEAPPAGFDPVLTAVRFRFKIECPSDFDCEAERACAPAFATPPRIDYLTRDYQSFRRLMLDRLSVLLPDWNERNPADLGVTLVELLAFAADRAAYFQDAVATEAYLDTARLRTSVRRHARLLDYRVHEGCNARAWVHLKMVEAPDGYSLPDGVRFLTGVPDTDIVIRTVAEDEALESGPEVFEAMHAVELLTHVHNEILFYTWGESRCVLPAGATSASLRPSNPADKLELKAGDVLVLEEVRHPETGHTADADPARRHAVRLLEVSKCKTDELYKEDYWDVIWHEEDALPFPLCLQEVTVDNKSQPVSVARGNIVLVDHGRTHTAKELVPSPVPLGRYRPRLDDTDLTWRVPYTHDLDRSASASLEQSPRDALPELGLSDGEDPWIAVKELLLGSDPFSREFVVEMESDGLAYIRFGDGVLGREPARGVTLRATYRTGRGVIGNVGAGAIQHVVSDELGDAVSLIRNPLPACGGVNPESLETVKLEAPAAFKTQMRAVTTDDWAEVTARHPGVQRAVATIRHTGSWHTVFITVDPIAGQAYDERFERELRAFLEQFRLAGIDLELRPPSYVPIDLALVICVSSARFRHEVKEAVLSRLSSGLRSDGTPGWFHPDRLSFGEDVYLSPIVAEVMKVPGVAWVDLDPKANGTDAVRFHRLNHAPAGELGAGVLPVGRFEVARLDNDPNAPDNGRLRLTMRGGR